MIAKARRAMPFVLSVLALTGFWEYIARSGHVNPLILPAPSAIAEATWFYITNFFGPIGF